MSSGMIIRQQIRRTKAYRFDRSRDNSLPHTTQPPSLPLSAEIQRAYDVLSGC